MVSYDEVKSSVMRLSESDQRRLIMEIVPLIWPKACQDDACVAKMREIVDEEVVREYREQHKGGI